MMLIVERSLGKNILFGFMMVFISSCSTIEIIDGICYNDKDLSHLCEIEEPISKEKCIRESECKYA